MGTPPGVPGPEGDCLTYHFRKRREGGRAVCTLKYRPEFPDRFGSIQDARAFCLRFFPWYNDEHRHSALGLMTPAMVHYDQAPLIRQQRQAVLDAACRAHPERFVRKAPRAPELQQEVWSNKPPDAEDKSQ